jgi:amidophosphoribosyltransferase
MSGLFGVVSQDHCGETLLYGTDYHSHLGTERAGLAVLGDRLRRRIHDISQAQFKSKFADDYRALAGRLGIGVISDRDPQPILMASHLGEFAVAAAGFIENAASLTDELLAEGCTFSEITDDVVNQSEIIAKIIGRGRTLLEGIEMVFDRIAGSSSFLVLTRQGIYTARDRQGRLPLVIGRRGADYAVASESCAFPNLGFEVIKELQPGEVVLVGPDGLVPQRGPHPACQICAFLWIYTGYPASRYEGINVEAVRERCGRCLARNDRVKADLVAGVPDSGVGHAIGYAMESGTPYRRPLVKYTPGYGRSYTPPSQEIRDLVAKMKLIPIREVIQGNRIVLCEDSIVRGTQLRNLTVQKLKDNGAREVHVRPACPPLMFPCRYALSTRSIHELAARRAIRDLEGRDVEDVRPYIDDTTDHYRRMVDWIRDDLGVTTLKYLRLDEMVEAIGLPRERLCLYCWTGT